MFHRKIPLPPPSRVRLMAVAVASCFAVSAQALPTAPTVVNGSASFNQTGNTLTITNSNGAVIDWNTFSIRANELARFNQPSASSSVLNRVLSNDPSQIFGQLQSNGRVWLINPAGILVGAGARIDTAAFVASTLNVRTEDFLAGRLNFQNTPGAGNVTVERGATIATPSGGAVYLIGTNVSNEGIITTPRGETILAAGQTISLIDTGTPGVKVEVTGAEGNVTNLGEVVAEAGRIGMAGVLVRNSGNLNASSVVSEGGRIFLKATGDTLVEGGQISATGTRGGRIEVLGDRVAVAGDTAIDASGASGGGTVLVGGDFQGANPDVANARFAYFGPQATIKADATTQGDGGKVIVWADGTTRAYGRISARGGDQGGNGGFAEVSGKGHLDFQARADLRAPAGNAGSLLLDPTDVTICPGGCEALYGNTFTNPPTSPPDYFYGGGQNSWIDWSSITGQLSLGNVTITTAGTPVGSGDITFNSGSYNYSSSNNLSLWANRHIVFNGGGINNSGTGAINMIAGWNGAYGGAAAADGSQSSGLGDVWLKNSYVYTQGSMDIRAWGKVKLDATAAGGSSILSAAGGQQWIQSMANNVELLGGVGGQAIIEYNGTGGTQTVKGANLMVQAHQNALTGDYNYWATVSSAKDQTIDFTGTVTLDAGGNNTYGGHGNYASLRANGVQQVSANSITLSGGSGTGAAGYDNYAAIQQQSTTGSQTITITGNNGALQLTGGDGSGTGSTSFTDCGAPCVGWISNNGAEIWNRGGGGQTINFTGTGTKTLALQGGSVGNGNQAHISNNTATGSQQILGGAAITLNDGNSGGVVIHTPAEDFHLDSSVGISSDSTQTINAASIAMTGDSAGLGGAYLGAQAGTTINVTGILSMSGSGAAPASALDANGVPLTEFNHGSAVAIGERGNAAVTLNVGGLVINSATTNNAYGGSPVMIGSRDGSANLTINSSAAINVQTSTADPVYGSNVLIGSRLGLGGQVILDAGATSIALGNARVGTGTTGLVKLKTTAGAISTTASGKIIGGSVIIDAGTGTVTLPAGTGGVSANSLALTGSTLSLLGNNMVANLSALGTGNIDYKTAAPVHLTSVGSTGGGISVTSSAGSGANIFVGTVTASAANPVSIAADGGIYDDNGAATNISTGGGNITLTSQGGTPGNLAISSDTSTTGSLTAQVAVVAGNSGGISIRNSAAATPASLLIEDKAATGNGVAFSHGGSDLVLTSSHSFRVDNGGDLSISAGGNMTLSAGGPFINLPSSVSSLMLSAGGTMDFVGGAFNLPNNDLALVAPTVNVGAGATISAGNLLVVAPDSFNVTGAGVTATNYVDIIAGNVAVDGGSINATNGDVTAVVVNDVRLNNGSSMRAGNDVRLSFLSSMSTLYLNETALMSPSSYLLASSPSSIHLSFLGRSAGGVVMDGVETIDTVAGSSGMFVVNTSTPAALGAGLEIIYGASDSTLAPLLDALTSSTSNTSENLADTSATGGALPPAGTSSTGSTVGGGEGEFGSNGEDKDKKNGDGTSGGKNKDEKPQDRKAVGRCTPA